VNHADLDRIARAHGICLLLQFGSTVTGLIHAKSDVDVAVLLERSRQTLEERGAMVHDLQLLAFKRYQDHRKYFEMERRFVADAVSAFR